MDTPWNFIDMEEQTLRLRAQRQSEPIFFGLFSLNEPMKPSQAWGTIDWLPRDQLLEILNPLFSYTPCKDELSKEIRRIAAQTAIADSDETHIINRRFTIPQLQKLIRSLISHPSATDEVIKLIRQTAINHAKPIQSSPPSSSPPPYVEGHNYYISYGDGKGAMRCIGPPGSALLVHNVMLRNDGFFVDDMYRQYNDPKHQEFLESLKVHQLPSEFLVNDGITRHHLLLVRKAIGNPPMPDEPTSSWGPIMFGSSP